MTDPTAVRRPLVTAGKDTDLVGLELVTVASGESCELPARDEETCVIVLSGVVDVSVDGATLGRAGGRTSVFRGGGHAIYLPPARQATLTAADGDAELAVATAPTDPARAGAARLIGPDEQEVAARGDANWSRQVRTILGPDSAAGRLLVGETINPPGNWSGYPPHKHDTHRPPVEVQLEEVYLFKVDPAGGFGVQLRYDDDGVEAFTVHDGDAVAIKSGYHPVVAAPGYSLYYLWVMAGEGREMIPFLDPAHAWVQESA